MINGDSAKQVTRDSSANTLARVSNPGLSLARLTAENTPKGSAVSSS